MAHCQATSTSIRPGKIGSNLPLLILLLGVLISSHSGLEAATCGNFSDIVCSAWNEAFESSATLRDGRRISCKVEHLSDDEIPRIDPTSESAGPPDFMDVRCYQVFSKRLNKQKAVLSLSWGHQESLIRRGFVTAYYLDFGLVTYYVTLNIEGTTDESVIDVSDHCIKFSYNNYGEDAYLRPGRTIDIRVQPVPESKRHESSNLLKTVYIVPDALKCWKPNTGTTSVQPDSHTPTAYRHDNPTYFERPVSSNIEWVYSLIAIFAWFIVAAILVAIYKIQKRLTRVEDEEETHMLRERQILILANIKNPEDCNKGHVIATSLRNSCHVGVVCDFENKTAIVYQQDPVGWYHGQSSEADTIIFVNAIKVLMRINKGAVCRSEGSEFEFFVHSYFRNSKNQGKKVLFIEDDHVNIGCRINNYPIEQYPRFLYKDSYNKEDPFYKELFTLKRRQKHCCFPKKQLEPHLLSHEAMD